MKKLLLIICLLSLHAHAISAHPGKTDTFGGHRCIKGCEEWGLFYEEYHLHDKDWKPIRISKKKAAEKGGLASPVEQEKAVVNELKTEVVTTTRYITVIHEEEVFTSNPLLLALLVLLMLLFILRRTREKRRDA